MDLVTSTFDLETGMRIASNVGNHLPNLSKLGLWVLELFAMYATDRRTDRQTDKSNGYCPLHYGRQHNNSNSRYRAKMDNKLAHVYR